MGNPRQHTRERSRDEAIDADVVQDKESSLDSCGYFDADLHPRRHRPQRSPIRATKQRRCSPTYSPSSELSDGSSDKRHPHHRIRKSPTPPSLPYSSSFDVGAPKAKPKRRGHKRAHLAWKRSRRMEKFKEGGKNVTFLSYDGTYGATDKILGYIQQFDSAFGGERFDQS